ncbi:MAG: lipase chaperone, partial [Bdellovibrionales bacterium]|nr:lipase chaperone [Massilia sp.]
MAARSGMLKLGAGALVAGLLVLSLSKPEAASAPAVRAGADPFAFVRSMEGTKPDGDVKQSAEGQLVVDAELGHLFDYYLAGMGEKDLAAIRSEIERELDRRLKPGAAAQAKRLLASYLDYKRALAGLEQSLKDGGDLARSARARMEAMQKLRAGFFTPAEIAGLFGFSDAYDLDALRRVEISTDAKLTSPQRAEKLAQLDKKLSPAMREEREAPTRVIKTEESVLKMREQGATDDDVYRVRAAAFSTEGANRLADLDREEAAWKGRIKVYLAERSGLPAGAEA